MTLLVDENLESLRPKIVNKSLMPKEIAKLIYGKLKNYSTAKLQLAIERADDLDHDLMIVNGFYNPSQNIIEISLQVNKDVVRQTFGDEGFNALKFRVSQALYHEQIHYYQYDCRDGAPGTRYNSINPDPQIKRTEEYLGGFDEIDARAHDICLDFTKNNCYHVLRNPKKVRPDQSDSLFTYMVVFGYNTQHPVIRRLLKRTYQWWKTYEI